MKLTEKQKNEAKTTHDLYWESYLKGDIETLASLLDDHYTQIGSVEEEVFFGKKDAVQFVEDTIDQIAGNVQMRNRVTKLEPIDDFILFSEQCDLYVLSEGEWTFYSKFRASSLMQKKEDGWKMVHQHSSLPDSKAQEGENIAIEKISAENLQLRDAIKRRTIELEQKNRELEIEAALERVRNRTLLMKDSSELNEAVAVFFQQLKTLNLLPTNARTYFCDIDADTAVAKVWMTHSDGTVMQGSHQTPLTNSLSMINYFEAWKRKEPILERKYTGETLAEYLKFLSGLPHVQEDKDYQQLLHSPPQQIVMTDANFLQGNIGVMSFEPLSKEALSIMVRFAKLFEFTYTRFLDLQKAEAQAREAQIEAALERVRARTMAMQRSDELGKAAALMFQQVQSFGVSSFSCGFNIWEPDDISVSSYMAKPDGAIEATAGLRLPHTEHPHFIQSYEARKRREEFFVLEAEGKELEDTYRYMFSLPDFKKVFDGWKDSGFPVPTVQISHYVFFQQGYLLFITYEPVPEMHDVFKRFSKVFEQTYTRFLDLQKAEAQAREAKIEAALERVRSRSMAMHKSEELREVVAVLYEQIEPLGMAKNGCELILCNEQTDQMEFWHANPIESVMPECYYVSRSVHPFCEQQWKAWKEGAFGLIIELKGKTKRDFETVMFTKTDFKKIPEDIKKWIMAEDVTVLSHATMKCGFLEAVDVEPLSEDKLLILQRFAKVFDQAYTRFLDIQKAEAQAREAQIEASLERVRARTMAMQRTDELQDAASLLFQQVKALGTSSWTCGFQIWDEDKKFLTAWMGTEVQLAKFIYPAREDATLRFYEALQRGETLYVEEIGGEAIKAHYDFMKTIPGPREALQRVVEAGFPLPTFQIFHVAYFSQGFLLFITYEHVPERHDIFKRFAKVFEQTYTRFLDLQKAEAQAREAKIEAALERVRARTMAMQKSDELLDVASILFQQVKALGVPQWNCGFNIWNIGDQEFTYYPGSPDGIISPSPCKISLTEHPIFKRFDESRRRGDDLFVYEKEGEEQRDHYQYMLSLPGLGDLLQSMLDAGFELPKFQIDHLANFSYGNLIFITYEHFPEMHDVFKRFAKVFEQTYTRFLDLQKAEAQARESQIQLALERVRARTMAMQHSSELGETSALLFQQIQTLGVPPWSCGFNIWEQGDTVFTSYMGSPDGTTLDGYKIPLTEEVTFIHFQESRDRGDKLFIDVLEGETLESHYRYFLSLPEIKKAFEKRAQAGEHHPTFQINHLANFSHGNLMFITYEPCPEAHNIFIRFAKVFEQTYTRFLDLQKAEEQAREAKIEAALERVRARTMAMHDSSELSETASVMFDQLKQLGTELWACGFAVCEKDSLIVKKWMGVGTREFNDPLFIPYTADQGEQSMYDTWKNELDLFTYVQDGDELRKIYEHFMTIPSVRAILQKVVESGIPIPVWQQNHVASYKHGYLLIITTKPFEEVHIFKRFAKVFEQTYTRFLDLQKSEAQAREGQIQLAMERVRARTMAMQRSDELQDVAILLFQQVKELGIEPWASGFNIWQEGNDSYIDWVSTPAGFLEPYMVDLTSHPVFREISDAKKRGEDFHVFDTSGKALEETYALLISFAPKQFEGILASGIPFPNRQINHYVYGEQVGLMFITPEPCPEAHDIFKRFGKVFEQTYTRFLDLQKAEAQAREGHIQLAMERVRARTMAMQHSDELADAASLFKQVSDLGIKLWSTAFQIWNADDISTTAWGSAPDGSMQTPFRLPYNEDIFFKHIYEARQSGKDFFVMESSGEKSA